MNDNLPATIAYAERLAWSDLLPRQYREKPANVLYAIEYGKALGLPAMAAITGVHVIEGKPSASAGLIGALVRKAGHKLRVRMENNTAIAEIVRHDDPDYTFRSEWTMSRAEAAGLTGKKVWQQYPDAMLKARAITEVARDACEEVLFGMHYTPEELGADGDADTPEWTVERGATVTLSESEWIDRAEAAETADDCLTIYQEANEAGASPKTLAAIRDVGKTMREAEQATEHQVINDTIPAEWPEAATPGSGGLL